MDTEDGAIPDTEGARTSLAGRARMALAGGTGRRTGLLRLAWAALCLALALAAGVEIWRAGTMRSEAGQLGDRAARAAETRERLTRLAGILGRPGLADRLGALRARLPAGTVVAEAAMDEAGALAIAIDTADPDALRARLRADPGHARLRERGQERRDGGVIRVRLVAAE